MAIEADWLTKMQTTMAVELSRGMTAGMPPKALIQLLFGIPEVSQAFALRANRRRPLALSPQTDAETQEVVEELNRIADWLSDDFHAELVDQLRGIAADLGSD